jgi:hypothetical protein
MPLNITDVDDEDRGMVLDGLRQRAAASRAAEQAAEEAVRDAERELTLARTTANAAVTAADLEQGRADYLADLRAAENEVARLKGALAVVAELGKSTPVDDEAERVLSAARPILRTLVS